MNKDYIIKHKQTPPPSRYVYFEGETDDILSRKGFSYFLSVSQNITN